MLRRDTHSSIDSTSFCSIDSHERKLSSDEVLVVIETASSAPSAMITGIMWGGACDKPDLKRKITLCSQVLLPQTATLSQSIFYDTHMHSYATASHTKWANMRLVPISWLTVTVEVEKTPLTADTPCGQPQGFHRELLEVRGYPVKNQCSKAGSPKCGLRAKSGPRRHFVNNEKRINLKKLTDLAIHTPKQRHYARCPALGLLCKSLCGHRPKSLEIPALKQRFPTSGPGSS